MYCCYRRAYVHSQCIKVVTVKASCLIVGGIRYSSHFICIKMNTSIDCPFSSYITIRSLFSERDHPGKLMMWQFFHLLFNIAVQQPFQAQWLLHDYELSRASFALSFKSLVISLLQASDESVSGFPSPGHFPSSGTYPLDPSLLADPPATACLTLRFTWTRTPLHHGRF